MLGVSLLTVHVSSFCLILHIWKQKGLEYPTVLIITTERNISWSLLQPLMSTLVSRVRASIIFILDACTAPKMLIGSWSMYPVKTSSLLRHMTRLKLYSILRSGTQTDLSHIVHVPWKKQLVLYERCKMCHNCLIYGHSILMTNVCRVLNSIVLNSPYVDDYHENPKNNWYGTSDPISCCFKWLCQSKLLLVAEVKKIYFSYSWIRKDSKNGITCGYNKTKETNMAHIFCAKASHMVLLVHGACPTTWLLIIEFTLNVSLHIPASLEIAWTILDMQ